MNCSGTTFWAYFASRSTFQSPLFSMSAASTEDITCVPPPSRVGLCHLRRSRQVPLLGSHAAQVMARHYLFSAPYTCLWLTLNSVYKGRGKASVPHNADSSFDVSVVMCKPMNCATLLTCQVRDSSDWKMEMCQQPQRVWIITNG